jgi:hypothetical protein
MNNERRTFLGSLLALIPFLGGRGKLKASEITWAGGEVKGYTNWPNRSTQLPTPEQEASHYFQWFDTYPFTTDNRYVARLSIGIHNVVRLDGQEVAGSVVAFVTGKNGWVECEELDSEGNPVTSIYDDYNDGALIGTYKDSELHKGPGYDRCYVNLPQSWMESVKRNLAPSGLTSSKTFPRWREKVHTVRSYGHVTYEDLRDRVPVSARTVQVSPQESWGSPEVL